MTIKMTHEDAVRAADLTNAVANSYLKRSLKRKKDSIRGAIDSLRQRVTQLASQIAENEVRIADHIRDNQLDVNRRANARVDLLRAEIKQIKARLQLSTTHQPQNESWVTSVQAEQATARLAELEQELERATLAEIRQRALEQELTTDRNRYNRLVERLVNLDSQADLQIPSARVISPAGVPLEPSFPRRKMIIAGGFAGSVMLSIMLALLIDGLVMTVRSDQRTMQILGLPNLAYLPDIPKKKWKGALPPQGYIKKHPQSFFAEAVRSLFMSCRLTNVDRPPRVIMLTSPLPGEGKSTVTCCLAVTAAALGHRTIAVDLDLHRCGATKSLGIDRREAKIGSYLRSECELADIIRADPDVPGLDFIGATPCPQPPSTLLNSDRLSEMLAALRAQYDIIILDTPAALIVNDNSFLAPLVDAAILVLRWGLTTESALQDTAMQLQMNNIPLIGTVINRVKLRAHAQYGYGGALSYYKYAQKYYSS